MTCRVTGCRRESGRMTLCERHLAIVLEGGTVLRPDAPLSVAPNRFPSAAPRGAEQAVTA